MLLHFCLWSSKKAGARGHPASCHDGTARFLVPVETCPMASLRIAPAVTCLHAIAEGTGALSAGANLRRRRCRGQWQNARHCTALAPRAGALARDTRGTHRTAPSRAATHRSRSASKRGVLLDCEPTAQAAAGTFWAPEVTSCAARGRGPSKQRVARSPVCAMRCSTHPRRAQPRRASAISLTSCGNALGLPQTMLPVAR